MRKIDPNERLTSRQWQLLGAEWEANVIADLSGAENAILVKRLAACWNAVRDALAEYDTPHNTFNSSIADRMAEILRGAVDA